MGWWADWRLKRRITLERRPAQELHERDWRLREPYREVLLGRGYRKALHQALEHVRHYVVGNGVRCPYCETRLSDPRVREDITVRMGFVTVFRNPPPDGRDLRIVVERGWTADVEHRAVAADCPKCGHHFTLAGERWGVSHPSYGFERLRNWVK